ncbi:MAG: hypothetical protein HUU55_23810 [Myxococcales bacterium]|nr:hypothetical protein [Myxococcales bacterium]
MALRNLLVSVLPLSYKVRHTVVGMLLLAFSAVGTACGPGPDGNSGPDAHRNEAIPVEPDKWIAGEISTELGDKTDWMSFTVENPTDIVVTVVFESEEVEAEVGLYDRYGMPVSIDQKRQSDNPRLLVRGSVPVGLNFVKVSAVGPKDQSGYTIQVALGQASIKPARPF